MDAQHRLFRQEAIDARRGAWLGTINVATPLSRWIWAALGASLAAAIILFLVFGHYTKRQHVTGQLVPSTGMAAVTAVNTGTVTGVFVRAGDQVHKGERLLEVTTQRTSARLGNTFVTITTALRAERQRLEENLATQNHQSRSQGAALKVKLQLLTAQQAQVGAQVGLQRQQAQDATALLKRIQPLLEKGYVSALQFQQQQATALSASAQLKALMRQSLEVRQQITATRQQLAQLPLDLSTRQNDTASKISSIDQQLAQTEAQRAIVMRAPRAGTVTTLLARLGQHVVAGEAMLSILPENATLQAQLMVPSRAVGFIIPGSAVVLRYQAYPYQRFGQQYGHVGSISRSALSPAEVTALTGRPGDQPVYRVTVNLDHQDIEAYGKLQDLKPGMALTADILMDRRSLLQWVFEPLYGLKGTMTVPRRRATSRRGGDSHG